MSGRRIGRLVKSNLLSERWLHFIGARSFGALTLRRQPAERGLDCLCVNLVELLNIGNYLGHLRREHPALVIGNFQMSELGNFFDVGF